MTGASCVTGYLRAAAAALLCLGVTTSAGAQTVKAPELRAAFLANFARFTNWPDDAHPAAVPFAFCVVDDRAVATALEGILIARQPAVSVRLVKIDPSVRSCQVLYVGKLDPKQSAVLWDTLQGASVFTVGDGEKFAESGGVAQFIVDKGRMRFAINVAAAQRAHLGLSSKLLSLATLVKDTQHDDR